jgi:hypothetical protein
MATCCVAATELVLESPYGECKECFMFGTSKPSLEQRMEQLAGATGAAARQVIAGNYFNFPAEGVEQRRYTLGSLMLASLMCEHEVTTKAVDLKLDVQWRIGFGRALLEALAEPASFVCGLNVKFGEMVVWQKEIETIRRRSRRQWGNGDAPMPPEVSLNDLLEELYCVRMPRMTIDFNEGAIIQLREGPQSRGLLRPIASTFIAQVTGDEGRAAHEGASIDIAVRLSPQWIVLREAVRSALH